MWLTWALVARATPESRVTVTAGLEPMPVFGTSFESTVGSRGVVVHGGVGALFVLYVAALEANIGVRLSLPGELVRPDVGVRVGAGGAAVWTVGAWNYTHIDATGGVRIGRGTALDLRAGPMLVMGWKGVDQPLPGLVCQVGVSIPFGPDPKDYEAGGLAVASQLRDVAAAEGAEPLDLAEAEVRMRRRALTAATARAHSGSTPELRSARRAARDALYEAIEARDQLRAERAESTHRP